MPDNSYLASCILHIVEQFEQFYDLSGTEQEFIVLDFQEMFNVNPVKIAYMIGKAVGGQYVMPKEFGVNQHMRDIWSNKYKVMIIFRLKHAVDTEGFSHPLIFSPRNQYFHNYSVPSIKVEEAEKHMLKFFSRRNPNKIECLGTNLTEQPWDIAKGYLNRLGKNPKTSKQITMMNRAWFHNWMKEHRHLFVNTGNIIHEDFIDGLLLTEFCKEVNAAKQDHYGENDVPGLTK
ncbi:MAG: hypothetical protein GY750_06505 [Lentisphaerae bacterium]|nr:hypothetical protein [Lentisphaerota bacterium]MCP4101060.1 hypothetical protein [Lentisphaerota bacterium]